MNRQISSLGDLHLNSPMIVIVACELFQLDGWLERCVALIWAGKANLCENNEMQ